MRTAVTNFRSFDLYEEFLYLDVHLLVHFMCIIIVKIFVRRSVDIMEMYDMDCVENILHAPLPLPDPVNRSDLKENCILKYVHVGRCVTFMSYELMKH